MPICIVCKSRALKDSKDLKFHEFPVRLTETSIYQKWILVLNLPKFPNKSSTVCSRHFDQESDYYPDFSSTDCALKQKAVPSKNLGAAAENILRSADSSPVKESDNRRQSKRIEKKKSLSTLAVEEDNTTPTSEVDGDETQITISSESEDDGNDDEPDKEAAAESEDEQSVSVICLDEETNDEPEPKPTVERSGQEDSPPVVDEQKLESQPTDRLQEVENNKTVAEGETSAEALPADNEELIIDEDIFADDPDLIHQVHEIVPPTPDTNKTDVLKINTKQIAAKLRIGQPSTVQQLQSLHDQLKTHRWQNCSACLAQMSDLIGHLKASHNLQPARPTSIKYNILNSGVQIESSQPAHLLPATTVLKRKSPSPPNGRPANKVQLIEQRIDSLMKQTNERGLKRFDISMNMIPSESRQGLKNKDVNLIKINTLSGGNSSSTGKASTDCDSAINIKRSNLQKKITSPPTVFPSNKAPVHRIIVRPKLPCTTSLLNSQTIFPQKKDVPQPDRYKNVVHQKKVPPIPPPRPAIESSNSLLKSATSKKREVRMKIIRSARKTEYICLECTRSMSSYDIALEHCQAHYKNPVQVKSYVPASLLLKKDTKKPPETLAAVKTHGVQVLSDIKLETPTLHVKLLPPKIEMEDDAVMAEIKQEYDVSEMDQEDILIGPDDILQMNQQQKNAVAESSELCVEYYPGQMNDNDEMYEFLPENLVEYCPDSL